MAQYLATFVIAGGTVTAISYIGNHMNPLIGGIVSGIPISIPSMLLIHKHKDQIKFISSAYLMLILLTVATILCWVSMRYWKFNAPTAVGLSVGVWVVGALVYYFATVRGRGGGKNGEKKS